MYVLYSNYPKAVPWRVAFYQSWSQFWPVLSKYTVGAQIKDLRKKRGDNGQVLVVPFGNIVDDFDTQTILPSLVEGMVSCCLFCLNFVLYMQKNKKNGEKHIFKIGT